VTLDELRSQLTEIDGKLLELIARRQQLSEAVAQVKRAASLPTRDFQREREVVRRGRAGLTQPRSKPCCYPPISSSGSSANPQLPALIT
jgi:chorismate mutase